jgi:hypothetical protein
VWHSNTGRVRAFIVFLKASAANKALMNGELSVSGFPEQLTLEEPDLLHQWGIFLRLWNNFHDQNETRDKNVEWESHSGTTGSTDYTSSINMNPEYHPAVEDYAKHPAFLQFPFSGPPISVPYNGDRTLQQSHSTLKPSAIFQDPMPYPSTSSMSLVSRIHQGTAILHTSGASNLTSAPSTTSEQLISANIPPNLGDISQRPVPPPINPAQPLLSTNINDSRLPPPQLSSQSHRPVPDPDDAQAETELTKERHRNVELQRSLDEIRGALATQEQCYKEKDAQWQMKCEKIEEDWKVKLESRVEEMRDSTQRERENDFEDWAKKLNNELEVINNSWSKRFDESEASRLALSAEFDVLKALEEQREVKWGELEREYQALVQELEDLRAANVRLKTQVKEGEVQRHSLAGQIDSQNAGLVCISKDLEDERAKCSNAEKQLEEMWARELLQLEIVRALQTVERMAVATPTLPSPEEVEPSALSSTIGKEPPDSAYFPDPKRRKLH